VLFERWWCETRRRSGWTQLAVINFGRGQLVLDPITWNRSASPSAMWPYRSVLGKVRVPGGRAWPVQLELAPWSTTHSELALRFTGRRVPRAAAVARYHAFVEEVLERLWADLSDLHAAMARDVAVHRRDAA
jgi:hypothetical protein